MRVVTSIIPRWEWSGQVTVGTASCSTDKSERLKVIHPPTGNTSTVTKEQAAVDARETGNHGLGLQILYQTTCNPSSSLI